MLLIPRLTSTQLADVLLHMAVLTIAVSGFCLVVGARRLAGRVFLLGCLLAASVVFASSKATMGKSTLGLPVPEWFVGWLTLAALGALVLRLHPRIVFGLAVIPIFVMTAPLVHAWLDTQPFWMSFLIYTSVGLIALQALLTILFGGAAAGHFTGVMLVRVFDLLISGPLRGLAGGFRLMRQR